MDDLDMLAPPPVTENSLASHAIVGSTGAARDIINSLLREGVFSPEGAGVHDGELASGVLGVVRARYADVRTTNALRTSAIMRNDVGEELMQTDSLTRELKELLVAVCSISPYINDTMFADIMRAPFHYTLSAWSRDPARHSALTRLTVILLDRDLVSRAHVTSLLDSFELMGRVQILR